MKFPIFLRGDISEEIMMKRPYMKAEDFTCMLCGLKLGLKFDNLIIGDNTGECPACCELFKVNITKDEMQTLLEAEENVSLNKHIL